MTRPQRAYELKIRISADNWAELVQQLDYIIFDLTSESRKNSERIDIAQGGMHSSYTVYGEHDPSITNEIYFDKLNQYINEHRLSRGI